MQALPIVDSLNKFSIETLQKINLKLKKSDNLIFSPYSAFACISMIASLFTNQTRCEVFKALQIQNATSIQIEVFLKQIKELIDKENTKNVASSNRVWANEKLKFSPETFQLNSKILGVPIEKVPFPQPGCNKINEEVNRVTKGMIPSIIDPSDIPSNIAIILTNAVYFQSNWLEKFVIDFESNKPDIKNFILNDGKQIHVDMLRSFERQLLYYENEAFQVVSIPYLRNDYQFIVILPKDKTNAGFQHLTTLTYDKVKNELLKNLKIHNINLKMPKFDFETKLELNEILESLGIHKAFTQDADCADPNIKYFVNLVLQKAKISVDENGTVAAAATVAMMEEGACEIMQKPIDMFVDHPFAYILRNRRTQSFIFEGFVRDPSK